MRDAEDLPLDELQNSCIPWVMRDYEPALKRVLEAVGGPSKLAEKLDVVPSAVTQWTKIPSRHLPRIEALTGIPGRELRPDLYPVAA